MYQKGATVLDFGNDGTVPNLGRWVILVTLFLCLYMPAPALALFQNLFSNLLFFLPRHHTLLPICTAQSCLTTYG